MFFSSRNLENVFLWWFYLISFLCYFKKFLKIIWILYHMDWCSLFFLFSLFYNLKYFLVYTFKLFFEVLIFPILLMLNNLVDRMIFFYSLLCLSYRRNIFSYFSEKKNNYVFLLMLFLPRHFLCSLNSFLFIFIWPLTFTFEAFLKCSKISYCPKWGFKMLIVISVCMGGACQLMDFTVQWSGFG